ncbi:hypothetical protein BBJ28_00002965 [Nothophytophthora sp. Chile5]|nr:hypothetical protein BBJ28_00002965 [Nothophytophthora sp. Chile5]
MEIGVVAAARPQSGSAYLCILLLSLLLWLPSVSADAAIASPLITPLSLNAGATGTVDVSFTTATTIPVGGTIVVTFASTFYVGCTALTNVAGFDPSSTVVAAPASAQAAITIATTDASTTVSGSTFVSTSITNALMTISSLNAGATVAYTVAFTTDVTLRIGCVIVLQFPILSNSKIVFSGASLTNRVNINAASTTVQVASPYLRLTIAGQDVLAGTAVSLTYSNIINPAAQTSGFFGVYTRHPTGAIFQGNSAVAGFTYASTTLPSSATLTPTSYFGGIVTTYTVQFAHAAYLPTGSWVKVTFPTRFDITGATVSHITNLPSVNTVLTFPGANMAQVTLGNVAVVAGTGRQFTLDGIVNPGSSCDEYVVEYCTTTWEAYTISITDSGNNLFEESTTVPGTPIVKKPLTYGRVRPVLKTPHTPTKVTVTINTEAVIPMGGSIDVVFPADYSVNSAMSEIAAAKNAEPISAPTTYGGNPRIAPNVSTLSTIEEFDLPVELTRLRLIRTGHCPIGNDPDTTTDETDCDGQAAPGGFAVGIAGNLCLSECSNRGVCNYRTGTCNCFPGYTGFTCQISDALST